eukprot:1461423-Prymnesium_polylepis.1
MEGWSWELQRPHLKAGNFAVIVGGAVASSPLPVTWAARRAGARLGHHSAVIGRCLELGPLPALNCGRLATWHRERHAVGGGDFGVDGE